MKKTEFVDSELEVIRFAEKDIIMSSDCTHLEEDGEPTQCSSDLELE